VGGRITRLRPLICPFEEILRRVPAGGGRVLDVGCGVGIMSALAAGLGRAASVIGFDVSRRAIDVARGVKMPGACDMTFHALPAGTFPEGEFDVVLCIDVLHHVPPAAQHEFLRQVCDHVAPAGMLIFKDISPKPWWKAQANRLHDLIMARQWVNYRHESQVAVTLRSLGGEVIEQSRLDRLWYSHYLICWRKPAAT
jgi:2-polyprenyl-3-methyl-5-hydroxy-6-metoxy-1,4-benzoquinol methylase